ncbi:hypothetical protein ACRAWC_22755 [Leifsonia sp. L25]|uniref:hypothetical protein n=1 Tax=Leifsonia sp. L25 TaxID=3423957 RepID=UPI003D680660
MDRVHRRAVDGDASRRRAAAPAGRATQKDRREKKAAKKNTKAAKNATKAARTKGTDDAASDR